MIGHPIVLQHAFVSGGFTCQSDYSRRHAIETAQMASMGLLTTELPNGNFSNIWRITSRGLDRLTSGHYYS